MTLTKAPLAPAILRISPHRHVLLAFALAGCPAEDDGSTTNVLPTQGGTDESSGMGTSSASMTSTSMTTTADSSGGETVLPAAYRFECVDIQVLGDADGTAFQAGLLEDTWNSDIDNYKLNIIFEVMSREEAGGMAEVAIRSGIGTGPDDQCSEPSSETAVIDVQYDPASTLWGPSTDEGTCSAMAAGGSSDGSYTMMLPADTVVYIYAQDTDGTTFNCTADTALPDAVPVRAVEAEITVANDGSAAGTLTGCLLGSEAQALCSCLGMCSPDLMNPDCAGCPNGSVPLQSLLSGINPSMRCSDLTGADAYDITLGFNATALPTVPMTCGGG
jgi:hypothetical protein